MEKINKAFSDLSSQSNRNRNNEIHKINSYYDGYDKGITDFANRIEDDLKNDAKII